MFLRPPREVGTAPAISLKCTKLLVVEGDDDAYFCEVLLQDIGLSSLIQVVPAKGKERLAELLAVLVRTPGFANIDTLAVLCDADTDAAAAFQGVCTALGKAPLPVPPAANQFAGESPRTIAYILPDCAAPGSIETLWLTAVAAEPALKCVDDLLTCLDRLGMTLSNPLKSRARAYLAATDLPTLPFGLAAQKGCWLTESPVYDGLRTLLKGL